MGTALFWFRRDLRLHDQPALAAACASHARVLPLCFAAEDGPHPAGAAAHAWRRQAIARLAEAIATHNASLLCLQAEPAESLIRLAKASGAAAIHASRNPEPWQRAYEDALAAELARAGISLHFAEANLLFAPGAITKADGTPYRVFTPFWRTCLQRPWPQAHPEARLQQLASWPDEMMQRWQQTAPPLQPWQAHMLGHWPERGGEAGAWQRAESFIAQALPRYAEERDLPGIDATSQLAAALHTGEIGIRQLIAAVRAHHNNDTAAPFLRQLGWREFAHQLLHAFPHTLDSPLDARFTHFPWQPDNHLLHAWQRGETGIPIVDAGMRQLWQTGWMHNRVRMLTASMLSKNLLQPWQAGAAWFMETLIDADAANNTLGWQWVAGCGADAAPYFRIFNPVTQGERFDTDGSYVRRWLPELARLPDRWIHRPWQAPAGVLAEAGIHLGDDYPHPICELADSRRQALAAFQQIKGVRP